jgi:hypothetical protein
MTNTAAFPKWQKWLLLYLGSVVLGAGLLMGGEGAPASWFVGWAWWQRLAVILLASPLVVALYLAVAAMLEGGLHAVWLALRHNPLATILLVAVVIGVILVASTFLASA